MKKRLFPSIGIYLTLIILTTFSLAIVHSWEIYYTPSGKFQIHYIPPGSGFPESEVTLDQVEIWGAIMDDARSRVLQWQFDNPERNERSRIGIYDLGINARGGISHGHGQMTFDPFFLGVPDVNLSRSATIPEQYAVAVHEYLHVIQFMYPGSVGPAWVYEGQARMMQDKIYNLCDQDDDLGFANYLGEVNGYLQYPMRNLFGEGAYDAALFWNYVCEQFGADQTEPGRGTDALYHFWEAAQDEDGCNDAFYIFEKMLERYGFSGIKIQDVFRNFVIANYAKDFDWTTNWGNNRHWYRYMDEIQPPGSYASVPLQINKTMTYGEAVVGTDFITHPWSPRYYHVIPAVRGSQSPITVDVTQISDDDLFFALVISKNNEYQDVIRLDRAKHFSATVMAEPGTELGLVVCTLEPHTFYNTKYHYQFSSDGAYMGLNILSPLDIATQKYACVGDPNDPDKFLAIIELLANGAVVPNVNGSDIYVEVGGKPANVTSCANVYGLYFLEIQAPTQAGMFPYDLTIRYGTAFDTEPQSVVYTKWSSDNMLVIDKSGSMGWNEKIDAAQAAASLFVNSHGKNNTIGLVQFNESANLLVSLDIVDSIRNSLLNQIDGIIPDGATSIGDGLFTAQNDLFLNGDPTGFRKHVILLTDGKENSPKYISDVNDLLYFNNTRVYVVLIGEDTNAQELQSLALWTQGNIYFAFDPASGTLTSDLAEIYRSIVEETTNEQRVFSKTNILDSPSWTINETFYLDESKKATIIMNYKGDKPIADIPVYLEAPDGSPLTADYSRIKYGSGYYFGHLVWNLDQPSAGDYSIIVNGGSGFMEYFAEASVVDPVGIHMYFPLPDQLTPKHPYMRVTGCEFPILATLTDDGPIREANVEAEIITGENYKEYNSWTLKLYDDGNHGDGLPHDGVYGNNFTRTKRVGVYKVKVRAEGYSTLAGDFVREVTQAFHLKQDADADKDGLWDGWETRYGMSISSTSGEDGPYGDNDNDGLLNHEELTHGTNPLVVDTDGGGETDYSEVTNNRDPYAPEDDGLVPPVIFAIPGDETATIYFQARPGIASFKLYRKEATSVDFTLVNPSIPATATEYNDTGLTNDHLYYYKMVVVNTEGAISDFSPTIAVTPKTDTIRPAGFVFINKGDKYTKSQSVQLTIITNDTDIEFMRISQDPSFEGVLWEPFKPLITFNLAGEGMQFVYVEMKDTAGNIGGDDMGVYAFDGITVDTNYIPISSTITSTISTTSAPTSETTSSGSAPGWMINVVILNLVFLSGIFLYRRRKPKQ